MHTSRASLLGPWAKLGFVRIRLVIGALLLSGCAIFRKPPAGPATDPMRAAALLDPGAPRLLVEIDHIAGSAPHPRALKLLEKRLRLYLDKPGGIKIMVDEELPAEAWDGTRATLTQLIRTHASPPEEGTAYIYGIAGPEYKTFRGMSYQPGDIKNVDFPVMALFTDRVGGILWVTRSHQEGAVLLHEVGHLVGLVTNDAHRDGAHCTNAWCLMYDGVDWRSGTVFAFPTLFAGQLPTRFCGECRRDMWGDQSLPGKRKTMPTEDHSM